MVEAPYSTGLAIDIGSSSGKAMLGEYKDGVLHTKLVHRIRHGYKQDENGHYRWDVEAIRRGIEESLEATKKYLGRDIDTISVDTWGVDYALMDKNSNLVADPHAYRDPRTEKVREKFYSRCPKLEIFQSTGVQPQDINTILQIMADVELTPEISEQVEKVLFLPDYFLFLLSGIMGWSKGIASTSALTEAGTKHWKNEVLAAAGIPDSWFGTIANEVSVLGKAESNNFLALTENTKVIRAGSHDTACAVNSLPVDATENPYFISCGSWSLAGVCTPGPLLSESAYKANLTNETRVDGGNRILKNMSGMWIFQECIRHWEQEGIEVSYKILDDGALKENDIDFVFDPANEKILEPGQMPNKIKQLVQESHGKLAVEKLSSPAAITRLVNQSLAVAHAKTMKNLQTLSGLPCDTIYMVGGGINNRALCQYTADTTGKTVVAGPEEASAVGNIIAQLQAVGVIKDTERKDVVKASFRPVQYLPDPDSKLQKY